MAFPLLSGTSFSTTGSEDLKELCFLQILFPGGKNKWVGKPCILLEVPFTKLLLLHQKYLENSLPNMSFPITLS